MMRNDLIERATGLSGGLSEVSMERLDRFARLVEKWNPSINVVAKSTIGNIWERHILDSIQLFRCAEPDQTSWLDLGSGGGFPGMVIAILAADAMPAMRISLVESDRRKSVFLSECSRQLGLSVDVYPSRIEDLAPQGACVVSARALAPLDSLCGYALRHVRPGGICAFLKGAAVDAEIAEAQKSWRFDLDRVASVTDSRSSILFMRGLCHV
jgi:16S rRNA (guanine527-N7)-methyltransferase